VIEASQSTLPSNVSAEPVPAFVQGWSCVYARDEGGCCGEAKSTEGEAN